MRKQLIFLLMINTGVHAQIMYATGEFTFSTYAMAQMKDFQDDYLLLSPFRERAVTRFPPYGGYGAGLGLAVSPRTAFGLQYRFHSTGGRVSYEDYSGSSTMDQLLRAHSFGGFGRLQIWRRTKWSFDFIGHVFRVRSQLDLEQTVRVGSESNFSELKLKSANMGFVPALIWQRNFPLDLFLTTSIGFEFQTHGMLKLHSGQQTDLKVQWDGFRFSLGGGIRIKRRERNTGE